MLAAVFNDGRRRAPDRPYRRDDLPEDPMLVARAGLVPGVALMHPIFYIPAGRVEEPDRAVGSLFPLEGGRATIRDSWR